MTFTYGFGFNTDLNKVRLLIRDTNSTDVKFEDEEINQFLDLETNVYRAAGLAARTMQALTAEKVSKTVGKLSIQLSDQSKQWGALADEYYTRGKAKGSPRIYAGGISVAAKNTQEADTDRVEPAFARGQHDFPGTIHTSTSQ